MEINIDDPEPGSLLFFMVMQHAPILFYIVNGSILIILLICSGLVSGSEVAFFSLSPKDIQHLKSGTAVEKRIYKLISKPKRLLATILILNNFINIAFVTLSTILTWRITGSQDVAGQIVIGLTAVITFLIVYFGEVVPKIYANQRSIGFAKLTVPLIHGAFGFFKPLSWLLTTFSQAFESKVQKKGYEISAEQLNRALELTTNEDTPEEEKGILKSIVNFGQLSVKQVMRSRVDIMALDDELDFHELMDKINKSGYSRIPIYKETIDNIEGILYSKDLLPHLKKKENFKWQKLIRPPLFVPETKKIDTLLRDFQEKHVHMAIVVDEYGGTSGLATLEDVIEEIVGEIHDESDDDEIKYNKVDEQTYIFEGKTTLIDFCKITNQDPNVFDAVKGESESLGGLILELYNKLPGTGEIINFENYEFIIIAVDQKRIKRIKVRIK
ncbi:MAG: gliding motility-associated protein GldE [Cytophagales bacterium]|nr:gliding motility-associated protein GldE [Cytophagales bacterium]